jgi:sugar lactone lactonase YvrE
MLDAGGYPLSEFRICYSGCDGGFVSQDPQPWVECLRSYLDYRYDQHLSRNFQKNGFAAIANFKDACGECPMWHKEQNALYWTDITSKLFYRYDWSEKRATVLSRGFEVCGFAFHELGGFVLVNSEGIWLRDGETPPVSLATEVDGIPCRMNDCGVDPSGRLLAGSCFFDGVRSDFQLGHLLLVDFDGSVRFLDEGIQLANGLGFSPDGRTLYFADSLARVIYAYDYDPLSGTARNRRRFVTVPLDEGLPDGLTVDAAGFVWSAQWFGSCIVRYDPDGKVERRVQLPARQITSLAFGGPSLTDIFVTSAALPDCLAFAPTAYNAVDGYNGGALFQGNENIVGRLEPLCRVQPLRA